MVSRENKIILACIVAAVPLGLGVAALHSVPDWAAYVVFFGVGVFLPGYLTGRYRGERGA